MTELFEMARDSIGMQRLQKRVPAGVILAGGGALLPGAVELASQVFDAPVRMGKPIDLAGWSEQVDSPQFATAVGLLRYALRQKNAQTAMGAQSTLGVVGVEPQRRIWSVPSHANANWTTPTPSLSSAELAQQSVYADRDSQREMPEAANTANQNGAHAVPIATEEDAETPFDRAESTHHQSARYEDYDHEDEPLWKRLLLKLRQFIGFESS